MKYLICSVICLLCSFIAKCEEQTYMLNLNNFTELKVVNGVNIEYHSSVDTVGKGYFTCEKDLSSRFVFSQDENKLKVEVDMVDTVIRNLPTIHLYSTKLEKVENTSDSLIIVHEIGDVDQFKVKVVGNGAITVNNLVCDKADVTINTGKGNVEIKSGEVTSIKYKNVGKGIIRAAGLKAKSANVILLGTGDIECFVEQTILIYGSGSGKVKYKGYPEKITNRSIGVKTVEME